MGQQHKRGLARTQTALLPPAVEDYVGKHALVRVIDRYVDGLDMAGLGFKKSVPLGEGRPPYAPDDLLKLYLYGYWNRVSSVIHFSFNWNDMTSHTKFQIGSRIDALVLAQAVRRTG